MQGRVLAHFEKSKNQRPNKNPLMEIFLQSFKKKFSKNPHPTNRRVLAHFEKSMNRKPNKNPLMEIFLKSFKKNSPKSLPQQTGGFWRILKNLRIENLIKILTWKFSSNPSKKILQNPSPNKQAGSDAF